jgi:hypothetical protein
MNQSQDEVNQSQENPMKSSEIMMTQDFFTKVYLLVGKLIPIVAIHSLEGSRAYRHHTPNPQSGATQPTQDEDHISHKQSITP